MITTIALGAITALTIIVLSEMARRYYLAKLRFEYRTKRLDHDDKFLAADGGEDGAEVEEDLR